jgi:hypothetical protein
MIDPVTGSNDTIGSFLPAIRAALKVLTTPISHIMRLVACEMALVILHMKEAAEHPSSWRQHKVLKVQFFALTQLSSVLLLTAKLVHKSDRLNFDSPQFGFVLGQISDIFQRSISEAGYSDFDRKNIMKHYSMTLASEEQQIRRETAKIGATQEVS